MGSRAARIAMAVLLVLAAIALAPPASARGRLLDHDGDRVAYRVVGGGRIAIRARVVPCRGFPRLRVWVDGRLDRTIRTKHRGVRVHRTARAYHRGTHVVTLVMRRDRSVRRGPARCDRRIRVLRVSTRRGRGVVQPAGPDRRFTLAVLGDTQGEVFGGRTFATRTAWLAAHRSALNLRFVAHTGDLVNWGWLDRPQYDRATSALARLTTAGIPWQVAVGNHDTAAVGWNGIPGSRGYGGAAYMYNPECPERLGAARCQTRLLLRDTGQFDARVRPVGPAPVAGTFAGRLDNSFSRFTAAGRSWLVLNLELWPRQAALTWAARVVAGHPRDNVIVLTHSYLLPDGSIGTSGSYGSLPASAVYRQLVAPYPNVKLVLSGHDGLVARRVDRPGGHEVVSFLGNQYGGVGVTRLVEIGADTGVVTSRWWAGTPLTARPSGSTYDAGLVFE